MALRVSVPQSSELNMNTPQGDQNPSISCGDSGKV